MMSEAVDTAALLTSAQQALERFLDVRVDDDGTLTDAGHNGEGGTWFVVTPKGEKASPA